MTLVSVQVRETHEEIWWTDSLSQVAIREESSAASNRRLTSLPATLDVGFWRHARKSGFITLWRGLVDGLVRTRQGFHGYR